MFTALDIASGYSDEQVLTQPDHILADGMDNEIQEEGQEAMIEESHLPLVAGVKTIHISSPILAAKSPFFYKLFSNGMKDSEQRKRHVNLRINASVVSCMRHCSNLLRNLPMTPESALLYLDLPSTVSMAEAVQPLTNAAKQFLTVRYEDINKFQDEILNLSLAGVEVVLSSDDLQVASEDAIYDFVLKWARIHYPNIEERRDILTTRLAKSIRFPYMTCRKLRKIMTCNEFDPKFAQKVVLEALFSKADSQSLHKNPNPPRAYKYRPVKVIGFELPRQ